MALLTYKPNVENSLDSVFRKLFDDLSEGVVDSKPNSFSPRTDIYETEKDFIMELSVPGMEKKDFKIDLDDDVLLISGERKREDKEGVKYHRNEQLFGSFEKSFKMTEVINKENIKASYDAGILRITLPKIEKKETKKVIDVK
ncbi:Hsp20/alpha crystallin family protein [Mangrovivirga sp. M17]|uniref:Hsp20/alpha crystallin family protein n=1 Tax=Mangrovivirga halotolerans TaxID=2993936 RepID=A0ABT3RMY4_9BACT|nr:Hsp20/alpha crystallin family protein [Mangrovivirga halotolerans]MCX2742962.1 Hsp20/alpha crystallin family protein [Mangrovivirga halotolerans]